MGDKPEIREGDLPEAPQYQRKSDKDIKELAFAVRANTVLGTWALQEHEVRMVFMPLMLMHEMDFKAMERDGIVHFYSYIDNDHTFPRSVNGLPMFHKMYQLNREDSLRLKAALDEIRAFMGDDDEEKTDADA